MNFLRRRRASAPEDDDDDPGPAVSEPVSMAQMPDHMLRWQMLPVARAAELAEAVLADSTAEQRRERGIHVEELVDAALADVEPALVAMMEGGRPESVWPPRARRLRRVKAVAVYYAPSAHCRKHAHTDNADLTLNICLRAARSGGDLYMITGQVDGETYQHWQRWSLSPMQPGEAMLFSGALPHGVSDVYAGDRLHVVVQYDWVCGAADVSGTAVELPPRAVPGTVDPGLCRGLPARLQIEVASFVGPATLANLCETSRAGYRAFAADALWPRGSRAAFTAAQKAAARADFTQRALGRMIQFEDSDESTSDYYTDEEDIPPPGAPCRR